MSDVVAARVRTLLGVAPPPPSSTTRDVPVPGVELDLDATVPGWVVRLATAALVLVCPAVLGGGSILWGIAVVAAGAVVLAPGRPVVPGYVVLVGFAVASGEDLLAPAVEGGVDGSDVLRLGTTVLCLHLALRGSALAGHVPWTGRVEGAVVGRLARSVVPAQVAVQSMLLLVAWVRGAALPGLAAARGLEGQEWLRVVAVVAAVGAVALVVPRRWLTR